MYDVILGCICCSLYCYYMYPNNVNRKPMICPTVKNILHNGSVVMSINQKNAIHFHHWIIFMFVISLSYYFNKNIPLSVYAFSICMVIQGLCYHDCFNIICNNPY